MNDLSHYWVPRFPKDLTCPIGCIGAGFVMSDCHLVAYKQAGFNPVAITSRTLEKAAAVKERFGIEKLYQSVDDLLDDPSIRVIDVAVPPDKQFEVIAKACQRNHIQGILAQKPLGIDLSQAQKIVQLCDQSGTTLVVNQNMRYDQAVRTCHNLLNDGCLGKPVLATIDMRAVPHWMPWQEHQGWVTHRIMSIHHLDTFRFWFGDPVRIYASFQPDPRTQRSFEHLDGICLYILEFENGAQASSWDDVWSGPHESGPTSDIGIHFRVEGTEGLAKGTIGWPKYPERVPSTLTFSTKDSNEWINSDWDAVWFPDAFAGPMAELLCAIESGEPANLSGQDNLLTMALVEAGYKSAREKRAIELQEVMETSSMT